MLDDPELAKEILKSWDTESWTGLTADEQDLMSSKNGLPLWRILHQFPKEIKGIIGYWARQMLEGMSHLTDDAYPPKFKQHDGIQILGDYQDYHQYCYIVAGTVGNLATDLAILHYNLSKSVADPLLRYSQACGQGCRKPTSSRISVKMYPGEFVTCPTNG